MLELTGKPESLKTIVPDRPGHDRRYLLDSTKLRASSAGATRSRWEEGIAQTVPGTRRTATGGSRSATERPVDEAAWQR